MLILQYSTGVYCTNTPYLFLFSLLHIYTFTFTFTSFLLLMQPHTLSLPQIHFLNQAIANKPPSIRNPYALLKYINTLPSFKSLYIDADRSPYYIYQSVTSIYNYIISEYKKLKPDKAYIQYIRTQNKHSQFVSICPSTPPTPTISEKISWFSH